MSVAEFVLTILSWIEERFEKRPTSVAGKCCAFPPFLPIPPHDHALRDATLPNNFCLNVLPSKHL